MGKRSNTKTPRQKTSEFRRVITVWHKRIGIGCAFFVILLSITGVLLNHTGAFRLDQRFVSSPLLLNFYSVPAPTVRSFPLDKTWLSEADSRLFLDSSLFKSCDGKLIAALQDENFWLAVCSREIILFSDTNELIEKVDGAFGLPVPIKKAGICAAGLCFLSGDQVYSLNLDSMEWEKQPPGSENILWQQSQVPPADILAAIENAARGKVISVEKLVLDIHAGRYFGALGPWFMDVVAVLLVLLSLSGIFMWWKKGRR